MAFESNKVNIRKKLHGKFFPVYLNKNYNFFFYFSGNYKSENIEEINKRTKTYEKLCKQNHTIKQYEKHCFNMETEFIKSNLGTKLFGIKSSNRSEVNIFGDFSKE